MSHYKSKSNFQAAGVGSVKVDDILGKNPQTDHLHKMGYLVVNKPVKTKVINTKPVK